MSKIKNTKYDKNMRQMRTVPSVSKGGIWWKQLKSFRRLEKLKEKGILEAGDKVVISGGRNYIKNAKLSKMIGGYVEI